MSPTASNVASVTTGSAGSSGDGVSGKPEAVAEGAGEEAVSDGACPEEDGCAREESFVQDARTIASKLMPSREAYLLPLTESLI